SINNRLVGNVSTVRGQDQTDPNRLYDPLIARPLSGCSYELMAPPERQSASAGQRACRYTLTRARAARRVSASHACKGRRARCSTCCSDPALLRESDATAFPLSPFV